MIGNRAATWLMPLVIFVLSLSGCGGGGGGGSSNDDPDELTAEQLEKLSLGIADARGFVITGDSGSASTQAAASTADATFDDWVTTASESVSLEPNTLYRATLDGRLEVVGIDDSNGDPLPSGTITPEAVITVNDQFVAMRFRGPAQGLPDSDTGNEPLAYLVESGTGSAFLERGEVDETGLNIHPLNWVIEHLSDIDPDPRDSDTGMRSLNVQTDRAGNLYISDFDALYRYESANVDDGLVERTRISDENFRVSNGWLVSRDGRFVVMPGTDTATDQSRIRLRLIGESGFFNFDSEAPTDPSLLLPSKEGLYLVDDNDTLFELTVGETLDDRTFTEIGPVDSSINYGAFRLFAPYHLGDRVIARINGTNRQEFVELNLKDAEITTLDDLNTGLGENLETIVRAIPKDQFLFVLHDDGSVRTLSRWDSVANDVLTFDTDGLEILEFRILGDDQLWLRGLRTATEQTVIAEVDADGLTELQVFEPDDPEVLVLTPINPGDFISVDGLADDWQSDFQKLTADSSGPSGDDMTEYRDLTTANRYYGITLFEGAIEPDHFTVVSVNQTHEIVLRGEDSYLIGVEDGAEPEPFSEIGALSAPDEAVEFYVPVSALGADTITVEKVERFESDGEANPQPTGTALKTMN